MNYDFKKLEEFGWFVGVAVATVLCQALSTMDVDKITDWRVWAVGLGAAAVRAAAGAVLSWIGTHPPGADS